MYNPYQRELAPPNPSFAMLLDLRRDAEIMLTWNLQHPACTEGPPTTGPTPVLPQAWVSRE